MKNDSLKIILIVAIIAIAGYFLYTNFAKTDAGQQGAVITGTSSTTSNPSVANGCPGSNSWTSSQTYVNTISDSPGMCRSFTNYSNSSGFICSTPTVTGPCPSGLITAIGQGFSSTDIFTLMTDAKTGTITQSVTMKGKTTTTVVSAHK